MRQKPGGWRFNSRSAPISPSEQVIKALRPSGRTQEPTECQKTRRLSPKSGWHLVSSRAVEESKLLGRRWVYQACRSPSDLSDLQNPYKHADVVAHTYNPRAGSQTQEDPWGSLASQHGLIDEFQASEWLDWKQGRQSLRSNTQDCLLPLCGDTCATWTCIHIYPHTNERMHMHTFAEKSMNNTKHACVYMHTCTLLKVRGFFCLFLLN